MRIRRSPLLLIPFFAIPLLVGGAVWHAGKLNFWSGIQTARAEEDDRYEQEYKFDDAGFVQSTQAQAKKGKSSPKVETVMEAKPVTREVTVTEPAFVKDTDGDGLVDGLDPDPAVDQRQYFTDDDHDGMPNVWDAHPGEDDFSYIDDASDQNHNGLLDAYESQ